MRHFKKGRKLSRERSARQALYKSLVSGVIRHGRIKTTLAKAKSAAPILERLITKAKQGGLSSYRQILKFLEPSVARHLIKEIAPRYQQRKGGYTRIVKMGLRKTDAARQAVLELV